jgi:hypothetical protein
VKLRAVAVLAVLSLTAATLAACDNPKPRVVPPDPMARTLPPPSGVIAPPRDGLTDTLAKRPEGASFYLDRVGEALDPLNKQPAGTPGDAPIQLSGFGFDPVAKAPGKGVEVVIDGKAYATAYGGTRQDVADYFKAPGLIATGYVVVLPAGFLVVGPHKVTVRVISADGAGYFESPSIAFTVD